MARKKNAEKGKIEAVPVLRSGGDDPTPETPVITKSYIMRDDWIDKGVVNTVAFKSVDGEVRDLLVNGEPAGGGGGGDFDTADATLIFNTNEPLSIADLAYIDPTYGNDLLTGDPQINTNRTLKVVLYKGASAWFTMEGGHDAQIVTSGAITNSNGIYNITGACTVTINAG